MRKIIISLLIVISFFSGKAEDNSNKLIQEGRAYNFLFSEHAGNRIGIVNKSGEIIWEYKCDHPQDVWMLEDHKILLATKRKALIINMNKDVLWEFNTQEPNEIPYCQQLPNGNIAVGVEGENCIYEIDTKMRIIHKISFQSNSKSVHGTFRYTRHTTNGNYILPLLNDKKFAEINSEGETVKEFPYSPISAVSVLPLPKGKLIFGCGFNKKVFETDQAGNTVWQLDNNELKDLTIKCVTGLHLLADETLVVCNWGIRENSSREMPHIFAVDRDKNVVWRVWGDAIGAVAQIHLLDDDLISLNEIVEK